MIDLALAINAVCDDLNAFFQRRANAATNRVVARGFSEVPASVDADGEDSIYFLVTRTVQEKKREPRKAPALTPRLRAPLDLNLHVMFAAMHRDYQAGLQALSYVMAYLQGKPLFTRENTPTMDRSIATIDFKMVTLDYAEQADLWRSLGAKYVPSAVYSFRVRAVEKEVAKEPKVTETQVLSK